MAYLLQQLLIRSAQRAPRQTAVLAEDRSLTYEQLDRLSNQLARALWTRGVGRGDRVGILAPKSAAAVVAVFAALKSGACYVPLDTTSPDERLEMIMGDSGISVVLADQATAPRAGALAGAGREPGCVIAIDWQRDSGPMRDSASDRVAPALSWDAVLAEPDGALPATGAVDTDLAYILYTSGSTGVPKGVMISHRASLTFVRWATSCAGLDPADHVCSPAPLHFDLSVFDIFATCGAGACLAVLPAMAAMFPVRLAEWIEQKKISVWYSVPSVLTMLATHGNLQAFDFSRLRAVIFAGEVFPVTHLARLMDQLPAARHMNWYGPTETNVCTWYEVPRRPCGLTVPVPIGRACTNVDVFAISREGRLVSRPGEEGELFVRGPGLMSGYWGEPEKSRQVLAPDPLQPADDRPAYRTGDMVTLDEQGNYLFLGRRDGMVKTRGYRVEVGEVETALYEHPGIREAAVLPVPDELLGNRLRAVVCVDEGNEVSRDGLLGHCRRRLPAYMVPDTVEFLPALPKTSTGKIDRVQLADTPPVAVRIGAQGL